MFFGFAFENTPIKTPFNSCNAKSQYSFDFDKSNYYRSFYATWHYTDYFGYYFPNLNQTNSPKHKYYVTLLMKFFKIVYKSKFPIFFFFGYFYP